MSENTDSTVAYFDANVWVAYLLGDSDRNYSFADSLFSEVDNRKHLVYVADLVLLETITSLRRRVAEQSLISATGPSSDPPKTVSESIERKISAFLTILKILEKEEKVVNKNPNMPIGKLHRDAFNYMTKYFGHVHEQGKHYRYSGLSHWDFQHALIAKALGASVFYTADKAFQKLKHMPQFTSLRFVIYSGEPA